MTFDRETRGAFTVIFAIAAALIGVSVVVNPAGLPDWAGVAALLLAGLAAGLWALSWRESVAANIKEEPEAVVALYTPPAPVVLPAQIDHPISIPDIIPQEAPAAVAPTTAPVVAEPEPASVVETVAPVVAAVAPQPESEPAPVVAEAAPEPVVEVAPEPAAGHAPVVEDASSVVEEAAAEAPPAPAVEVQAETVVHDAAAAPETPPTAEAINLAVPDDFTKIEGIGKYYNDALHKLGITTFADLAQQNAEGLVAQLKANGYRQHPAIPTWAEQAALAAAGDWDGLAALQKTLDGGRRTEG